VTVNLGDPCNLTVHIRKMGSHTRVGPHACVAHTAQIGLARVDHTAWPKILHSRVAHTAQLAEPVSLTRPRQPHTAMSVAPVSHTHDLTRRSHGCVSSHGLHTGSPQPCVASTVSFSAFVKLDFCAIGVHTWFIFDV
ncbi:hypothetical protein J1N35_036884, partial [Gossypium stocksii]